MSSNAKAQCQFAIDRMGTVALYHPAIREAMRVAHLTDLHCLPVARDDDASERAAFVRWQSAELGDPNEGVERACRAVAAAQPDLIIVSGDMVDSVDDRNVIEFVIVSIQQIGAPVLYARGNHERPWTMTWSPDWSSSDCQEYAFQTASGESRLRQLQFSRRPFDEVAELFDMSTNPTTGSMDYARMHGGIRFIVLDTSLGNLSPQQVQWAVEQAKEHHPFLIVTHVPLPAKTLVPRIRDVFGDMMRGHVVEDEACRQLMALTDGPNCLGVLSGHLHLRSDDRIGAAWQWVSEPALSGGYRIVDLLPAISDRAVSPTNFRRRGLSG